MYTQATDISPGSISPGNVSNLLLKTASVGEFTPSLATSLFNYPCCWKSASLTSRVTWLSSRCNLLRLCLRDWKLQHLLPVIKSPLSLSLINSLSFMSKVWFAIWGLFGSFPLNFCWYFHMLMQDPGPSLISWHSLYPASACFHFGVGACFISPILHWPSIQSIVMWAHVVLLWVISFMFSSESMAF